jgi:hypothetical protein
MILGKETKLGKKIVEAGFPYCYQEKGWCRHCNSCIKMYKKMIKKIK